jgi:hypothetical protein
MSAEKKPLHADLREGASAEGAEEASHERVKRAVPDRVQLYVAEFRRRAAGLAGDELEAEIARLMDRLIERQLAVAPEGVRPELRRTLLSLLANDPAFAPMLAELRASASRGSG